MTSTSASRRTARAPASQTVFPDEIWEEIFVRLDAAADVIRVSATCSSFSRIVLARPFLRRFGSLHSPPILGFVRYRCLEFLPVEPPHRSAPAADFTFSFFPNPSRWFFRHALDGRVLLSRGISAKIAFKDFVVCDPLHRRYVKIPRIPDDLLVAYTTGNGAERHVLPVLAPGAENDGEESFRVVCTVQLWLEDKVMAFVFSSCNQTWRRIIHTTCSPDGRFKYIPYYAHGCFYWMVKCMGYSVVLDTSEMKFSIVDLPPHNFDAMRAIFEAADGRLGFVTACDGRMDLYSKNRQSSGVGAQEWQHDKLISLPTDSGINYRWDIVGAVGRYVALLASRANCCEYFLLDIKTMLIEKLCTSMTFYWLPYARFPPPLALPSI